MCLWSLPRQLFPSRCSIPVIQLQTGPVILLVQICSQPPLSSSHQSDSKETSQVSQENPRKYLERWKLWFYTFLIRKVRIQTSTSWTLDLNLTSPSYGSNTQYVLFMFTALWVHSSLVWTILHTKYTCINTADIVSSPSLFHHFRWKSLSRFSPLCRRLSLSHTGRHRSAGGPHRNPQWTWRRWHGTDRWVTRHSLPCRWCCP